MAKIILERKKGDMGFDARDEMGHVLQTDTSQENGGDDYGYRPMQLLLAGLGSCSAIDIMLILKKQRQQVDDFSIEVEGEREKDMTPALWKTAHITFHLKGNIDPEKAERAVLLSMERYCSVAETLRRGGTVITWETHVSQ
ncbi:MAG TPA: OsmC family protein [Chitinophagaceae bacterium]